ncbi:cyclase family protein [Streptomyces sp. NPDC102441]|uniref:cyclase family protein n=1 Tax=Streptomyces sp. NPDC102441 TaxID=3366176 RepID=UPI0038122FD7
MGKPTAEEVISYFDTLSNWGRWGDDDRLGTLNHITPSIRKGAAALVETGNVVSLSRDIDPRNADPLKSGLSVVQRYMALGEAKHHMGDTVRFDGNSEYVGIVGHGSHTHLDGLAHYTWDGKNYNGYDADETDSIGGAQKLSIHHASDGIITRGVLLDIAALHGVQSLEPGHAIMPDELTAAEERQGVTVRAGDALIFHTGHVARALQDRSREIGSPQAGLHAACLPYLRERDIAVLGSDCIQDVQPSGFDTFDLFRPIHVVSLVAMGLWLIDNMELTELAGTCAAENRWEFLFTMLPWRFVGVTASATNPVAVL